MASEHKHHSRSSEEESESSHSEEESAKRMHTAEEEGRGKKGKHERRKGRKRRGGKEKGVAWWEQKEILGVSSRARILFFRCRGADAVGVDQEGVRVGIGERGGSHSPRAHFLGRVLGRDFPYFYHGLKFAHVNLE